MDLSEYSGGNARIIAGPGTGKSTWIVERVRQVIVDEGVDPEDVIVLTYSVATAGELRARLEAAVGAERLPRVSTLHSYCFGELRRHTGDAFVGPTTLDSWEQRHLLCEDLGRRLGITGAQACDMLDAYDAAWRTLGEPPPDAVAAKFEDSLEALRSVFGFALIGESVYKFKRFMDGDPSYSPRCRYLLVDEYQDLNPCDLAVIHEVGLRSGAETVVVGDDDQCIYRFRHADPSGLQRFPQEYPEVQECEKKECWRCPSEVLEPAKRLIRHNEHRITKELVPQRDGGVMRVIGCRSPENEVDVVVDIIGKGRQADDTLGFQEILILVPTPKVAAGYVAAIRDQGWPVRDLTAGDRSMDDERVRRFLYLLRLKSDIEDQVAMRGWLATSDQVGTARVEKLVEVVRTSRESFSGAAHASHDAKIAAAIDALKESFADIDTLEGVRATLDALTAEVDLSDEARDVLRAAVAALYEGADVFASEDEGSTLLEQAEEATVDHDGDGEIRLMTYRKAKGLGERLVIVTDMEDALIPGRHEDVAEQRRLAYVAFTRSREHLFVLHVAAPRYSGSARFAGAGAANPGGYRPRSRFIDEANVASVPWKL